MNVSLSTDIATSGLQSLGAKATSAAYIPVSGAAPTEPSAVVTLSALSSPPVVYEKPPANNFGLLQVSRGQRDDSVSTQVLRNQSASSWTDQSTRLQGLGSALLHRFKTTQSDYQFSVVDFVPYAGTLTVNDKTGVQTLEPSKVDMTGEQALDKFADTSNTFHFKIHTRSGTEVDILISNGGFQAWGMESGLGVSVQTQGTLTDAEKQSIAKLADGFEAALQGLGASQPRIDVSGLVHFDSTVLSSVDLTYSSKVAMNRLNSFDFHADAKQLRINMKSAAGDFSIDSDLGQPALLGDPNQRQASVQRYLSQFDAAVIKGHGDKDLLQQFKDSFAQLNGTDPQASLSGSPSSSTFPAPGTALLTGLADFRASIGGDFQNGSTGHYTTEAGHFDYQVDQKTVMNAGNQTTNGELTQTQNANLVARILTSKNGNMLDTSTGNFNVREIKDSTQSKLVLAYARGQLIQANKISVNKESQQFTLYEKFKVVSQSGKPHTTTTVVDLLQNLNGVHTGKSFERKLQ